MGKKWHKNTQAGARSEDTMFLHFPPRTFKAQEVGKLATRSYEANHKMQKAQEVRSWLALVLLVQRADHGLCFPKHKSLPKGRDIMLSFFLGNI